MNNAVYDQARKTPAHEKLGTEVYGEGAVDDHCRIGGSRMPRVTKAIERKGGERPVIDGAGSAASARRRTIDSPRGKARPLTEETTAQPRIGLQRPPEAGGAQLGEAAVVNAAAQSADAQTFCHQHEQGTQVRTKRFMLPQLTSPRLLRDGSPPLQQQVRTGAGTAIANERNRHPAMSNRNEEAAKRDDDLQFRAHAGSPAPSLEA